jgi:hypothetical protein
MLKLPTRLAAHLALVVCLGWISPCSRQVTPANAAHQPQFAAGSTFMDALRLRRSHLVRPDLVPYPMVRDYYC